MLGFVKKQELLKESQPLTPTGEAVKILGEIHTMPSISGEANISVAEIKHPKKIPLLGIITAIVIIIAVGAAVYYFVFFNKSESQAPNTIAPVTENKVPPSIEPPAEEPETGVALTPRERDQQRFLDINLIKTGLELYYADRGSYPIKINQIVLGTSGASTLSAAGFSDFPQAPLYLNKVPQDPLVSQGGAYTYISAAGIDYQLSFSLEQGVGDLSSGTHFLTPAGFDKTETTPPSEPETEIPSLGAAPLPSLDSDGDGLTDAEEIIYGSLIDNIDTDGDGYSDGSEVKFGYNPVVGESAKLEGSGIVERYTNERYNYSILYPLVWKLQSLDELSKEVIFTGESGEFAQVVVQDNPEQKTALEWYASYLPSLSLEEIPIIQIGEISAVKSLDTLNVYLAVKDKIITISYNNGTHSTADYLSTFQMMYQSFRIINKAVE